MQLFPYNNISYQVVFKRMFFGLVATLTVFFILLLTELPLLAGDKVKKITLAGPFAAVLDPLIRMAENGSLLDAAEEVEFVT